MGRARIYVCMGSNALQITAVKLEREKTRWIESCKKNIAVVWAVLPLYADCCSNDRPLVWLSQGLEGCH
jgi:hypothetical protein